MEKKRLRYIFYILLVLAVMFVIATVLMLDADFRGEGFESTSSRIQQIDDGWLIEDKNGNFREFYDFGRTLEMEKVVLKRIFVFDDTDFFLNTLSFFAHYCAVEVYQDGVLIYSFSGEESIEKREVLGLYNVNAVLDVIPGEASEVVVKLYSFLGVKVNPFYFGSGYETAQRQLIASMPEILFSVLNIVLMVLIVFFAVVGRKKYSLPTSYIFFLLLVVVMTTWVISNIKVLSSMGVNPGYLCIMANEVFLLFPILLSLYIYYYFNRKTTSNLMIVGLSFLNLVVVNILVLTKAVSLTSTFVSTALIVLICLVSSMDQAISEFKEKVATIRTFAMFLGSSILLFGMFVQGYQITVGKIENVSATLLACLALFNLIQSISFLFYLMRLISEGRKAGDYLTMAKTDTLTGLGNRRGLEAYIADIANSSTSPFFRIGCIVCDLNGLKKTNDTYGHDVGDKMLKDFANCLRVCFENRGVPFRSGGDEFYVMFSDVEVDMGAMMRRLMIGIEGTNTGSEYKLSCSSGCYADYVPAHNERAIWDIIKLADSEMYKQKMKDRERFNPHPADDSRLEPV